MSQDITHIIQGWKFDPRKNYRIIVGDDGKEKIQIRVDNTAFQGLLQMELDGRPDGKQPHGYDFTLDYYKNALEFHRMSKGTDQGFKVDSAVCAELFDESQRIYNRYVFLLQLQDYHRVILDTERNMELFRFVHSYAEREEDRMNLEKWWPYILRINATALAMRSIQEKHDFEAALKIILDTRRKIESLEPLEAEEFVLERERSRKALDEMEKAIKSHKPLSIREKLEIDLEMAVTEERFEDAALLRDKIKAIENIKRK